MVHIALRRDVINLKVPSNQLLHLIQFVQIQFTSCHFHPNTTTLCFQCIFHNCPVLVKPTLGTIDCTLLLRSLAEVFPCHSTQNVLDCTVTDQSPVINFARKFQPKELRPIDALLQAEERMDSENPSWICVVAAVLWGGE